MDNYIPPFDITNNICTSCAVIDSSKPFWSEVSNKCKECPEGTEWNEEFILRSKI